MTLSPGKKVVIKENYVDIFENAGLTGVEMYLDSEVTLNLSSTFDELLSFNISKNFMALTQTVQAITGKTMSAQTKESGYRMWTKTEPISFSITVSFNMTYSGEEEVFKPIKVLAKLPLPSEVKGDFGFGLTPPGPSILTAMGKGDYAKFERNYSFRCGIYYLDSVVIEKAEPTFSSDVDDRGFPIWGTVTLDIKSLYTATTDDLDKFGVDSNLT